MGGISDVDLENGPVEEPEGKEFKERGKDGWMMRKAKRPGRNVLSYPVLLSRQPSTKQIQSRGEM